MLSLKTKALSAWSRLPRSTFSDTPQSAPKPVKASPPPPTYTVEYALPGPGSSSTKAAPVPAKLWVSHASMDAIASPREPEMPAGNAKAGTLIPSTWTGPRYVTASAPSTSRWTTCGAGAPAPAPSPVPTPCARAEPASGPAPESAVAASCTASPAAGSATPPGASPPASGAGAPPAPSAAAGSGAASAGADSAGCSRDSWTGAGSGAATSGSGAASAAGALSTTTSPAPGGASWAPAPVPDRTNHAPAATRREQRMAQRLRRAHTAERRGDPGGPSCRLASPNGKSTAPLPGRIPLNARVNLNTHRGSVNRPHPI